MRIENMIIQGELSWYFNSPSPQYFYKIIKYGNKDTKENLLFDIRV